MSEILSSELLVDDPSAPSTEQVRAEMEEEYLRCRRDGVPVIVLALALVDLERLMEAHVGCGPQVLGAILTLLREAPRGGSLYAYRSGNVIIAMLPGTPRQAADLLCRLIIADALELSVKGFDEPLRTSLSIGIAQDQENRDLFFQTLVLVAEEGVAVAKARGGECCVHTELYGLLQGKAERLLEQERERKEAEQVWSRRAARREGPGAQAPQPTALQPTAPEPVAEREAAPLKPSEQSQLRDRLLDMIEDEARRHPDVRRMQQRLREMADAIADESLRKARKSGLGREESPAPKSEHRVSDDRLSLLERRIGKLTNLLEETEGRLQEMAALKAVEPGVPSAYRGVQGLSTEEENFEMKRSLMRRLLEANLELRGLTDNGSAA